MKWVIFLVLVILISSCSNINKETKKEGPFLVTNVVDGDTLDLNNSKRVRLSGINTPETGECYYEEAKDKLNELTLGREVYLEGDYSDEDKYGRLLRYIYINDLFVNQVLVEQGYAKVFDKYKEDTKKYEELKKIEVNAVENKLGLWGCVDNKKECLYVGSKNSNKYYPPECKWAKRVNPENLVCYKSEDEVKDLIAGKGC